MYYVGVSGSLQERRRCKTVKVRVALTGLNMKSISAKRKKEIVHNKQFITRPSVCYNYRKRFGTELKQTKIICIHLTTKYDDLIVWNVLFINKVLIIKQYVVVFSFSD